MRFDRKLLQLSASDLAKHLACRHLTSLDFLAARGDIKRPYWHDPSIDVLAERGLRHETAYLNHLQDRGFQVLPDQSGLDHAGRVERTLSAMRSGTGAIVQADLNSGRWRGRADVLLKVNRPSALGAWSYEVVDTKLARETRGGTILQLCLYSELIADIQGCLPDHAHVVTPGCGFQPQTFRLHDFLAYYRFVKSRLENAVLPEGNRNLYPEPVEHCEICDWWPLCNDRRRNDDHLSFVAGISKLQIAELSKWDVTTLAGLAKLPLPLQKKPERGAPDSYIKVREQARLQFEFRTTNTPVYELLAQQDSCGLARLPEPSPGDIFLDFEADPFVEDGGLEYLLGYVTLNSTGEPEYSPMWAFDRSSERRAFESFVDLVMERRSRFPRLHIYHFSHYEPSALKRLMGRYATREDEIDRLLRAGIFVDLYGITKQSLRGSVETYSLKDLEVFFGFVRKTDLRDARTGLRNLECALELNEVDAISPDILATVEAYNREDCVSTLYLRNWLEGIRHDRIAQGQEIPRPPEQAESATEAEQERRKRALALMARLLVHVPEEPGERTPEQQALWLLAHLLEWHRREEKAPWWEYFRLKALTDDERLDEHYAVSGLEFVKRVGGTSTCPIDRYRFPVQNMQIRQDDSVETSDDKFGKVVQIDSAERSMDVKKTGAMAEVHPKSLFAHTVITAHEQAESLFRLGTWVADHGIDETGRYRAARDLLLGKPPRLRPGSPSELYNPLQLEDGVLPIQGPPGAGKTYTAARMICELLRAGKTVGVTAISHKVIRKLLEEVLAAAKEKNVNVRCAERLNEKSKIPNPSIPEITSNKRMLAVLEDGETQLVGGTAWLWAREEFAGSVDFLFVDEAGQMSLADVLAVSQAANNLVMLGDPQQLEQPVQGTHPPGVAVSALQHVLGTDETMPAEKGLFLSETWRLAPSICDFTSELFYENRLKPHEGLERQKLTGPTRFAGTGLWYVPAMHEANQTSSDEECGVVAAIVCDLLQPGVSWIDAKGNPRPMTTHDILVVSPYNAQVFNLADRLPELKIGTVDKFQGQEAPVVIYSMATSSPEEAPRGMEFLYSANRFNVATSRARCACILVANPRVFEPECQTPHRMKLANVLCRYREMAQIVAEIQKTATIAGRS